LKKEQMDEPANLIYIIKNSKGKEVRRLISAPSKGVSRISWNLRGEATNPVNTNGTQNKNNGFLVPAGTYSVEVVLLKNGISETLVGATNFNVKALNNQTLIAKDPEALDAFRKEVAELNRKVSGSSRLVNEMVEKLGAIEHALITYPNSDLKLLEETKAIRSIIHECTVAMNGDGLKASMEFETVPSISGRLGLIEYMLSDNTTGYTETQKRNIAIVQEEYQEFRAKLDNAIIRIKSLETKLEQIPVPYIRGKDESWKEH